MKTKFYNQYDSIIQTIRDNPGIKQWEVVLDNRHLTGRGTILTRLKELEDAGVVVRDNGYGKIVRYYLDDTTAFDRLGKPVQKSRHDRLIEESEALMRNLRAASDKAEPEPATVEGKPVVEPEELDEKDAAIRDAVRAEFADLTERKWLSFRYLLDQCGDSSLDQMDYVLQTMVIDRELVEGRNDDEGIAYYGYSYRRTKDLRWQKSDEQPVVAPVPDKPGPAIIIDRIADFLRTSDKAWQSVNKIAATFGIEADAAKVEMDAACNDQPERFRGINLDRDTKKKCDIANDNTVRFYGLVERVKKAATTPVEPVEPIETVEAPVAAATPVAPVEPVETVEAPVAPEASEAPVEAPTPALTLQQIIEQATHEAIELTSRNHAVEMARLMTERDAALEQLAAIKKLVA